MRICRTRSCIFNSTFLVVYRETKLRIFCYRKIYFHSLKHNIFSPQSFYRTFELWVYVCGFLFSDFWSLKNMFFKISIKGSTGVQVLRFFVLWDTLYLLSGVLVHHLYRETACRKIHLERKLTWAFYATMLPCVRMSKHWWQHACARDPRIKTTQEKLA
jgi:hypothetical protein